MMYKSIARIGSLFKIARNDYIFNAVYNISVRRIETYDNVQLSSTVREKAAETTKDAKSIKILPNLTIPIQSNVLEHKIEGKFSLIQF